MRNISTILLRNKEYFWKYYPVYGSQSNKSLQSSIQEQWKMVRIFIFESKRDPKIYGEAISRANRLRNRLFAGCINLQASSRLSFILCLHFTLLLMLRQSGYVFLYGLPSSAARKFLPRTILVILCEFKIGTDYVELSSQCLEKCLSQSERF